MNWRNDWGLRGRMILTMTLLLVVYIIFVSVIWWSQLFILLVPMIGFILLQFSVSDRLALYSMGATRVSKDEYPEIHTMVNRLSQQANVPKPSVAVADSRVPNAFAAGRSSDNATVAVTTGLLQLLTEKELSGVIAHEIAHVKNRDVMVMTIASFLSTVAFMIVRLGVFFTGGHERRGDGRVFIAVIASLAVWIVSYVLIRSLSRYREYAADEGGVAITGNPSALASALMKLDNKIGSVPNRDLREQSEMNAFFIIPVNSDLIGRLFSTHPSTEQRVDRLREIEVELEKQ
jgi:heat shock protein HtpX